MNERSEVGYCSKKYNSKFLNEIYDKKKFIESYNIGMNGSRVTIIKLNLVEKIESIGRKSFHFCQWGTVFASIGIFTSCRFIFIPKVCSHYESLYGSVIFEN